MLEMVGGRREGAGKGDVFQLRSPLDPFMNMQTQIGLFPLGTRYYSQILISLQIPPVN